MPVMQPSQPHPSRCDRTLLPGDAHLLCGDNRNITKGSHNPALLRQNTLSQECAAQGTSKRVIRACPATTCAPKEASQDGSNLYKEPECDASDSGWRARVRRRLCR